MLEDRMLLWKIKHGSSDALSRVYEKYKKDMFSLANALLHDYSAAEDVVNDVFVSFVQSVAEFKLTGSLKGYLLTCVANLSRDKVRAKKISPQRLNHEDLLESNCGTPSQTLITAEQLYRVRDAIVKLPYEQREVVILHLQTGQTFRKIAQFQQVSVSTVQSRYRYGLEKLRALLNSEVNNEARR